MRIVLKLGSSLVTAKNGIDSDFIKKIADEICSLSEHDFIIITSGAISTGMRKLKIKEKPRDIALHQALAAVGQGSLMRAYERIFADRKILAQVLLTNNEFCNRLQYLNIQHTLNMLIAKNVIPVINENDTVTAQDIKKVAFGDNDSLSAQVAVAIDADMLIILTDVDGVYDRNPMDKDAKLIKDVKEFDDKFLEAACSTCGELGRGGMYAKVKAAKLATEGEVKVVIVNGGETNVIKKAISSEIGTLFHPSLNNGQLSAHKNWIAFASEIKGKIFVKGATAQTCNLTSVVLPSDVISTEGDFEKGDVVEVICNDNRIARGMSNYSFYDLNRVKGMEEIDIFKVVGYAYKEVISQSNLVKSNGKH